MPQSQVFHLQDLLGANGKVLFFNTDGPYSGLVLEGNEHAALFLLEYLLKHDVEIVADYTARKIDQDDIFEVFNREASAQAAYEIDCAYKAESRAGCGQGDNRF